MVRLVWLLWSVRVEDGEGLMVRRFHIPVVVTAHDDFTEEEIEGEVEALLAEMEDSEYVYRTYVENSEISEDDESVLLDMLDSVDDLEIISALNSIETIASGIDEDGGETDG